MSVSLNDPGVAVKLADEIKRQIDLYAQETYDDGPRKHLGASLIGHECTAYLWFLFRWAAHEKHSGRMQRLFQRGHLEEARYEEYLAGIGIKLSTIDPETGKQYRVSGCGGHFGGSLDGIANIDGFAQKHLGFTLPDDILAEFKTNGTGAAFQKLFTGKLPVAKYQHYAQTSVYGYKRGFTHVLYLNTCKNDDDMYVEVAKLDHGLGHAMEQRAEYVIRSPKRPMRCSDNPAFWLCKSCVFADICHNGAPPKVNCRSCRFAVPIEGAEWYCTSANGTIPQDFIPQGCGNHEAITRA